MEETITIPLYKIHNDCTHRACFDDTTFVCQECPLDGEPTGFLLEDTGTDVIINDKSQVVCVLCTYTKL